MTNSCRRRPSGRCRLARNHVVPLVLAIALLSACGPTATNDDDYQFASRTQPPRSSVASPELGTPVGTPVDAPGVGGETTPDPASLLTSEATAAAAFFLMAGKLVVAHVDGRLQSVPLPGPATKMSVSPNGATVAVLVDVAAATATPGGTATPDDAVTPDPSAAAYSVMIVDARGEVVRSVDDVMAKLGEQPEVTDALAGDASIVTVALGPNIDDLIVAFADGLLVRVPTTRPATIVPGSGNLADVRQVVWSPNGKALAIVAAETPDQLPAVFYTPLRSDGIDPVRIAPAPGRTTDQIAWLPDASGVVFTDAAGPLDEVSLRSGRDLFVTPLRSDRRTLVAAAGIIGPAAGVVDFAIAPGSDAIAYTLYRTEGAQVRFNSLWVGSLKNQGSVQIALPGASTVVGMAWTSGGLLVLVRGSEETGPEILLVGPDGVATAPQGPGASTP